MIVHDRSQAVALMARAMALKPPATAVIAGPAHAKWNVAGNCNSPVYREIVYRDRPNVVQHKYKSASSRFTVEILARCRKCSACAKSRAALWRGRARAEISEAVRTWFGTLMLTPHEQFQCLCEARVEAKRKSEDFDTWSHDQQYRKLCAAFGRRITLYFKRLRKQTNAPMRYVVVFEKHKSGLPHAHLLVHEGVAPVRHKQLVAQWPHGFTKFNLVSGSKAAAYVTKYLSKSAVAKIRASVRYGRAFQGLSPSSVVTLTYPERENMTPKPRKYFGTDQHGEPISAATVTGTAEVACSPRPRLSEGAARSFAVSGEPQPPAYSADTGSMGAVPTAPLPPQASTAPPAAIRGWPSPNDSGPIPAARSEILGGEYPMGKDDIRALRISLAL